ncbi:MAG: hypothetical protein WBL25_03400 [Anaerolineales bacterium]
MNLTSQRIAELELIIPTVAQGLMEAVPGVEVVLRKDIVILSSHSFPSADINRAYLFRTKPERTDGLIDEVVDFFKAKDLPASIMVSPACQPDDLPQRLEARGFLRQGTDEAWMVLEKLQKAIVPKIDKSVTVKRVENGEDVATFAQVMTGAYDMPSDWSPYLAQILEPTITVPGFAHYIAFVKNVPAATLTLMRNGQYATIGSGGVLPEYRGTRTIYNMAVEVLSEAKREGVQTVVGQTSLGPKFERYLRIGGFKLAFRRTEYKLA